MNNVSKKESFSRGSSQWRGFEMASFGPADPARTSGPSSRVTIAVFLPAFEFIFSSHAMSREPKCLYKKTRSMPSIKPTLMSIPNTQATVAPGISFFNGVVPSPSAFPTDEAGMFNVRCPTPVT